MFGLGVPELLLILGILIIIFGAGKLSEIGGAMGKSIREFRTASGEIATTPVAPVKDTTV
ncbi:MAG TPA: twin-arginine translocase TatA/TatE family subunit [Chloroflexia bacterium]|nr:twin-arginine translocase TatA/TatE family subunit [Chloroflexia bacterium]